MYSIHNIIVFSLQLGLENFIHLVKKHFAG